MRLGALHRVAFANLRVVAEQHGADLIFFQVQRDAEHAVRKFQHLAGHAAVQPVHARDAVAHRNHRADFLDRDRLLVISDLLAQNLCDFVCLDICHPGSYSVSSWARNRVNCSRTEPS